LGGCRPRPGRSQAPAGTRSLADTPFQLILPREHLLGDWYGLRSWLEDHGITPTLTFVTDALGNPTGGMQQGFRAANNLGLDLRFDLEKLYGPKGGSFELSISQRFGSSLSEKTSATSSSYNRSSEARRSASSIWLTSSCC